jgi:transposase InsO family protein
MRLGRAAEIVESFHGRLRDECLNAHRFRMLNDVRRILEAWRQEYNCERPHSSLDYRTPWEFSIMLRALTCQVAAVWN